MNYMKFEGNHVKGYIRPQISLDCKGDLYPVPAVAFLAGPFVEWPPALPVGALCPLKPSLHICSDSFPVPAEVTREDLIQPLCSDMAVLCCALCSCPGDS